MTQEQREEDFKAQIQALLADESLKDNPLLPPFQALFQRYCERQYTLERLIRIADQFQWAEREQGQRHRQNHLRTARQLEKIVRISDRYHHMMRELNERLHILSTHDELTGLVNRRYGLQRLEEEINYVNRHGGTFCVALADIDHFKAVNDTYGHAIGDQVLIHVAHGLRDNIRDYDLCARWGGEEFMIVFTQTNLTAVSPLAERLRIAVNTPIATEQATLSVTISIGVTEYQTGEVLDHALVRADQALYEAKTAARNRVIYKPALSSTRP